MFSIRLLTRSASLPRINFRSLLTSTNCTESAQPTSQSSQMLQVPAAELETSTENLSKEFLIDYVLKNQSTATSSFSTLLEQLNSNANLQLPYVLPYENVGRKNVTDKSDLAQGIVTIVHVLPSKDKVVVASGFAVLDGGLIVTCAHTFYQAARHCCSSEVDSKSQTIVITHEGEPIQVAAVESHLVSSDLVLLRLRAGRKITSLAVDPYPAPVATPLLSYEFVTAPLPSTSPTTIVYSWKPAEVLFYRGRCGQEVEAGTYDELVSMMYSHPPSSGSSGGPIVNKETRSVVGIVRGSEVSYANRKLTGFAIPSECLFEAFRLPGMPEGLD